MSVPSSLRENPEQYLREAPRSNRGPSPYFCIFEARGCREAASSCVFDGFEVSRARVVVRENLGAEV